MYSRLKSAIQINLDCINVPCIEQEKQEQLVRTLLVREIVALLEKSGVDGLDGSLDAEALVCNLKFLMSLIGV